MSDRRTRSVRNKTNEILYKNFEIKFSIRRTDFNTIEVYWPSYSDKNANILLNIFKDKIKYLCKHRSNGISSIIFPSVCRLGRNTIMIKFVEWLLFIYQNHKIKHNIQIIFVSQKLVVNINNYDDLKPRIIKELLHSHQTIKNNLLLKGYSDDEKEEIQDYSYMIDDFKSLLNNNEVKVNKSSSQTTIFINRHSSDNISYIRNDDIKSKSKKRKANVITENITENITLAKLENENLKLKLELQILKNKNSGWFSWS